MMHNTGQLLYRTMGNVYLHDSITLAATPTHVRVTSVAAAKYMDVEGEKIKRFRVHVVQELYQTERDYVHALEFTVNVRNHSNVLILSVNIHIYYLFFEHYNINIYFFL